MPERDTLIVVLCWTVAGVGTFWGSWLVLQAIGIERALRQCGGWHAWRWGKR